MTNGTGNVTNRDLYDALNGLRHEHTTAVSRIEDNLQKLQSGKIADLESRVTNLQIASATATTKLAVVGFIASSIIGALISSVIPRLIK